MLIDSNWNICRKLCWIMKRLRKTIKVLLCKTLRSHLCGVFLTFPARSTPAWRSAPPVYKCLEIWLWYQRDISSENLKESRYETTANDRGPNRFVLPSSRTSESSLFVYQLWGALIQHIYDAVTVTNHSNITHVWIMSMQCWDWTENVILH